MTLEIEIPCSECGSELREQLLHVSDLPLSPAGVGYVRIAVCSECGARYYPEQTLSKLADAQEDPRPGGGC